MLVGEDNIIDYKYNSKAECEVAIEEFASNLHDTGLPDGSKYIRFECIDHDERIKRMRQYQEEHKFREQS
jgi:hypothetical protein